MKKASLLISHPCVISIYITRTITLSLKPMHTIASSSVVSSNCQTRHSRQQT